MPEENLKGKIYTEVLVVIGLLLAAEIILGVFFTKQFGAVMSTSTYYIGDHFGWWINSLSVLTVILGLVLIVFNGGTLRSGASMPSPTSPPGSGGPFPSAAVSAAACCTGPWANLCSTL